MLTALLVSTLLAADAPQDKKDPKDELARLLERARYDARAEIVEALLKDATAEEYLAYADQLKRRGLYEKAAIFYLVALKTGPKELAARASYRLACNFALWEQPRLALDYLQKAVDAGFWGYELMREDDELKSLRDHAVYKKLLAEVQKRYEVEAPKHAGGTLLRKPDGAAPAAGWPVLLLLHGYGSNKENLQELAALAAKHSFVAIAVSGPVVLDAGSYRWSAEGAATTHEHLLKALDEHKDQKLDRQRVYVGGFSQGALHAVVLTATRPDVYGGALVVSPGGLVRLPEQVANPGRPRPLYLLAGKAEPAGNLELQKECAKLWHAAKWPIRVDTHEGGHSFPEDWPKRLGEALEWLAKQPPGK